MNKQFLTEIGRVICWLDEGHQKTLETYVEDRVAIFKCEECGYRWTKELD